MHFQLVAIKIKRTCPLCNQRAVPDFFLKVWKHDLAADVCSAHPKNTNGHCHKPEKAVDIRNVLLNFVLCPDVRAELASVQPVAAGPIGARMQQTRSLARRSQLELQGKGRRASYFSLSKTEVFDEHANKNLINSFQR